MRLFKCLSFSAFWIKMTSLNNNNKIRMSRSQSYVPQSFKDKKRAETNCQGITSFVSNLLITIIIVMIFHSHYVNSQQCLTLCTNMVLTSFWNEPTYYHSSYGICSRYVGSLLWNRRHKCEHSIPLTFTTNHWLLPLRTQMVTPFWSM